MTNAAVSRRVARALYATPNALDTDLLKLCSEATATAESFEDLPERVRKIVLWVEQYIGAPGEEPPEQDGGLDDGEVGA